jgi:hypothetical protein
MNKKLLTICLAFASTALLIAQVSLFSTRPGHHNGGDSTGTHNDSTEISARDSSHFGHHPDSLFNHHDSIYHHSDSTYNRSDSTGHGHGHDGFNHRPDSTGFGHGHNGDVNRPDTTGHGHGHNGDVNRPDTTGHGHGHNGDVDRPDTTGHGHGHNGDVNRPDTTSHGHGHNGDVNRPDSTGYGHGHGHDGYRDSTYCRPDTGEVARPDTVTVPSIKGRQVVKYPETYTDATTQSLSFSLVGDSLRMQGDIVSIGCGPHYVAYKYYGDSIVLKRIDMGMQCSSVNVYGIDVFIPGATGDSYKVTLLGYSQLQTATGAEQSVSRNLTYRVKRMDATAINSASTTSNAVSCKVSGRSITLSANGATSVSLYDVSGKLIARKAMRNGTATLSAGSASGTVVYSVSYPNSARKSGKLAIR